MSDTPCRTDRRVIEVPYYSYIQGQYALSRKPVTVPREPFPIEEDRR
jgi:hypothetical protein